MRFRDHEIEASRKGLEADGEKQLPLPGDDSNTTATRQPDELLKRYQRCAERLWRMFARDPLPDDHPAQSWLERLEALLELGLVGPVPKPFDLLELGERHGLPTPGLMLEPAPPATPSDMRAAIAEGQGRDATELEAKLASSGLLYCDDCGKLITGNFERAELWCGCPGGPKRCTLKPPTFGTTGDELVESDPEP